MSQLTKLANKARFEAGDRPTDIDFSNLFDSVIFLGSLTQGSLGETTGLTGNLNLGGNLILSATSQIIGGQDFMVGSSTETQNMAIQAYSSANETIIFASGSISDTIFQGVSGDATSSIRLDDSLTYVRFGTHTGRAFIEAHGNEIFNITGSHAPVTFISGSVGINTTTPKVNLHVFGRNNDASLSAGSGEFLIGSTTEENIVMDRNEIMARNNGSVSTLHMQSHGGDLTIHNQAAVSSKIMFSGDGRLGLGTVSPSAKIHINTSNGLGSETNVATSRGKASIAITGNGSQELHIDHNEITSFSGSLYLGAVGSADDIHFRAGTSAFTNRMVILGANGNVGIGTSSPTNNLHVYHASANANIRIQSNKTDGGAYIRFQNDVQHWRSGTTTNNSFTLYDSTNTTTPFSVEPNTPTNTLYLEDTGMVGIGHSDPDSLLHIKKTGTNLGDVDFLHLSITSNGTEGKASIKFSDANAVSTQHFKLTFDEGTEDLKFLSDSVDNILYMDNGGNVGIGINDPETKLSVLTNFSVVNSDFDSSPDGGSRLLMGLGDTSGDTYSWIQAQDNGASSNNNLIFQRYGGNVGIGTTSPSVKFHVKNPNSTVTGLFDGEEDGILHINAGSGGTVAQNDAVIRFQRQGNSKWGFLTAADTGLRLYDYISTADHTFFETGGNVGIGTVTPSQKLDIHSGHIDMSNGYGIGYGLTTTDSTYPNPGTDKSWYSFVPYRSGGGPTAFTNIPGSGAGSGMQIVSDQMISFVESDAWKLSGQMDLNSNIFKWDGAIIAQSFSGDGSGLTNVPAAAISGFVTNDGNNKVVTAIGDGTIRGEDNLTFDQSTGRLGIGTANPTNNLHVDLGSGGTGNDGISISSQNNGTLKFVNGTGSGDEFIPSIYGQSSTGMTNSGVAGLYLRGRPAQDHLDNPCIIIRGQNQAYSGASTASDVLRIQNYTTNLITVDKDGQLGIGTTNPTSLLDLRGALTISNIAAGNDLIEFGTSATPAAGIRKLTDQNGLMMWCDSSLILHAGDHEDGLPGDLGIVAGTIDEHLYLTADTHVYIRPGLQNNLSNAPTGHIFKNDGKVGIGTLSPTSLVDIVAPDSEEAVLSIRGTTQGTGRLYIGQSTSYGGGMLYDGDGSPAFAGSAGTDRISFYRNHDNVHHPVFSYYVTSDNVKFEGKVGIGITSPASTFDVKGDLRVRTHTAGRSALVIYPYEDINGDANGQFTNAANNGKVKMTKLLFYAASGSNDSGFIAHESSRGSGYTNKATLHLVPSDDVDGSGDYVTVHGNDDPEYIRMYTNGLGVFERLNINHDSTTNARLQIQQSTSADGYGINLKNADATKSLDMWVGTGGAVIDAEGTTNLHLRTDNIDRLFINNSTGKVGIGTTSPDYNLDIEGSSSTYARIVCTNSAGNAGLFLRNYEDGGTGNTMLFYMAATSGNFIIKDYHGTDSYPFTLERNTNDSTVRIKQGTNMGRVGINTTTPVNDGLNIGMGNQGANGILGGGTDLTKASLLVGDASTGIGMDSNELVQKGGGAFYISTMDTNSIRFRTNGASEVMTLEHGGNVGIGTTNPAVPLHIRDNGDEILRLEDPSTTGSPYLTFYQNGARRSFIQYNDGYHGIRYYADGDGTHTFSNLASTNMMRIQANGKVGIGTTNPGFKLDVVGNIKSTSANEFRQGYQSFSFPNMASSTYNPGGVNRLGWWRLLEFNFSSYGYENFTMNVNASGNGDGNDIMATVYFSFKNQQGSTASRHLRIVINNFGGRRLKASDLRFVSGHPHHYGTGGGGVGHLLINTTASHDTYRFTLTSRSHGNIIWAYDTTYNINGIPLGPGGAGGTGYQALDFELSLTHEEAAHYQVRTIKEGIFVDADSAAGPFIYNVTSTSSGAYMRLYNDRVYIHSSTIKLKRNVQDAPKSLIDSILDIKPRIFEPKNPEEKGSFLGFIAEELVKVDPKFVTWGDDVYYDEQGKVKIKTNGKFKLDSNKQVATGVENLAIISALVGKVQDQEKRISNLEARLIALENK